MPKNEEVHINPFGFREYDARWLYPKDINNTGIKNVAGTPMKMPPAVPAENRQVPSRPPLKGG